MNPNDGVEFFFAHREHHPVSAKSRVANQNIHVAKTVDGGPDHRLRVIPVRHVSEMRDGLAAQCLDFFYDRLTGRFIAADSVRGHAKIADHDARALFRQVDASARPSPRPAPVTIATLPSSSPMRPHSF